MLTSNDILDNIQFYDSTIEVIGYVDGIEAPRYVGNKQQYKVFKFFLNNGNGKRIQVITWNDDIDRVEPHIKSNYIIYLDGVQARPPKAIQFNNGNVPYELQIRSNTIISNLGKYKLINLLNKVEAEHVQLSDVLNTTTRVIIEGYIKTNFGKVYNNKLNKIIGCGSITDGEYKLEVHIMNFNENDYNYLDFKKGSKIKIIGTIQTVDPPYFIVQSVKDISLIDGHMPLDKVIKVARTLERNLDSNSLQQQHNKKNKME
ncbi:uncharacterized protein LOC118646119 [Monomorium pharaonis]|uniref:uncharacterized protein LOC118646119 n=1 Tax=Monomorium pharaonis TaxID=307658 RepID=UPI001745F26D|nr:uncharacterized protein LOC118646119 [Monomorium pharaonis]